MYASETRSFEPLEKLEWTAKTEVGIIRKVVAEREEIFSKHRQLLNPTLEAESRKKQAKMLETDTSSRGYATRYKQFCSAVNIPEFPLSMSSIALYLFAKTSHQNGYYRTNFLHLSRIRRETEELWEDVDGFIELEDVDEVLEGVKEFLVERKTIQARAPRGATKSSSSKKTRSSLASEVETDDSGDFDDSDDSTSASSDDSEYESTLGACNKRARKNDEAWTPMISVVHDSSNGEIEQLPIPNLPRAGDSFPSSKELFIACARAVIPVYGNGVMLEEYDDQTVTIKCSHSTGTYSKTERGSCKWKIGALMVPASGEVLVLESTSYLFHNHGQARKLVKNSDWRPPIRNPILREAFGLAQLSTRRASKISPSKKSKLSDLPTGSPLPSSYDYRPQQQNLPENKTSTLYKPYVHSRPSHPSVSIASPSVLLSTQQSTASSAFYPQLNSFLKALHPSLTSLTPHLIAAGIDTSDSLTLLCSLESDVLDKSLKVIQARAQALNQPLSIIHLKLFKKRVEEARGGNYQA